VGDRFGVGRRLLLGGQEVAGESRHCGARLRKVPGVPLSTTIEGERVLLRPPRSGDARGLRDLRAANVEHLAPWNPLPRYGADPLELSTVRSDIARARREWRSDTGYAFLIVGREPGRPLLGYVHLSSVTRRPFDNAYLGYWIAAERQGEGLMTEAVRLAVAFAFEALGLHRVQAAVIPRNAASRRVLAKVGFREEGVALRYLEIAGRWEDHILHAITREESSRAGSGTRQARRFV
jgi:ribosomal-protein-alanine N-acetyltransferase